MNEKSRQAKAEFKRRYGEARKHLIQFGYVQANGKSRIEAGTRFQDPHIFDLLKDHFTMVTGRDYRQLIAALADKEARLIDDDVRPDATAAANSESMTTDFCPA